jgi:hypothetical protein
MRTTLTIMAVWIACVHGTAVRAQGSDEMSERARAQAELDAQHGYVLAEHGRAMARAAQESALLAQSHALELQARAGQEKRMVELHSLKQAQSSGDLESRVRELERKLQVPTGGYRENMTLEQRVEALERRQQGRGGSLGGSIPTLSGLFEKHRSAEAEGRALGEAEGHVRVLELTPGADDTTPRKTYRRMRVPFADDTQDAPRARVGALEEAEVEGLYAPIAPRSPRAPLAPRASSPPRAPEPPRAPMIARVAPRADEGDLAAPNPLGGQRADLQRQIEERMQTMRAEMDRMREDMERLRAELEEARSNPR